VRTSIATVCLSGTLGDKLAAASAAGFDGVEIFEPDLVASPLSPEAIREMASDLGLSLDLYQPFRDFEGVEATQLEAGLRRAEAKFLLMRRLGIDTMLLCSNVGTASIDDDDIAAQQLRRLGDLAAEYEVRIAYEALAWGRFISDYERAARLVRLADHDRIGMCLDSFHILSTGSDPDAIESIDPAEIFFVQVADAPLLALDVLSWSRHHRLFPGEGEFDLARFMGRLARSGYDGPVSLEVFNDTFRQSDPRRTAIDARRSLRWLEHETTHWLAANPSPTASRLSTEPLPAVAPPDEFNYVELRTSDAIGTRRLLAQLGFADHGAHRTKTVELWSQGAARIVLGDPSRGGCQPTIASIGFTVPDPELASGRALELLAEPIDRRRAEAEAVLLGAAAPDGSEIFFGRADESGPQWMDEFGPGASQRGPALIERIDHINLAQSWESFDAAVLYLRSVLDLQPQPSLEVAAPIGLVRSQVLRTSDGTVRIALNLAPTAASGDAILPQHVAFATSDVRRIARLARARGFRPLRIPANYYDDLRARYDLEATVLDELQDLDILYDRDDRGEFLHFYTPPVGSVFFEVVERRHGYDGYGAANAPIRLAAQYEQRRVATEGGQ